MFLIYHRRSFVRQLARELDVPVVLPAEWADLCRVRYRRNRMFDTDGTPVAINWGLTTLSGLTPRHAPAIANTRVLNRTITCGSKVHTFEVLQQAGIQVPHFSRDAATLGGSGRYLGRRDGLARGDGITIYAADQQPERQHDFYVRVVSKAHELRFHVWGDDVIYTQRKVFPNMSGQELPLIRSYNNGARFSSNTSALNSDTLDAGKQIAIASVRAMGMDFAAVDMAITNRGQWVVFELNSAPGISRFDDESVSEREATADRYMRLWRGMIRRL